MPRGATAWSGVSFPHSAGWKRRNVFGSDHRAADQAQELLKVLSEFGEPLGVEGYLALARDYVSVAEWVCDRVAEEGAYGVLVCGTGHGVSIVANKHKGISAARCLTPEDAIDSRSTNNANVLCLSAKNPPEQNALIVRAFFGTPFEACERKRDRMQRVRNVEAKNFK